MYSFNTSMPTPVNFVYHGPAHPLMAPPQHMIPMQPVSYFNHFLNKRFFYWTFMFRFWVIPLLKHGYSSLPMSRWLIISLLRPCRCSLPWHRLVICSQIIDARSIKRPSFPTIPYSMLPIPSCQSLLWLHPSPWCLCSLPWCRLVIPSPKLTLRWS